MNVKDFLEIIDKYGVEILYLLLFLACCIFLLKHIVSSIINILLGEKSSEKVQLHINKLNRRTMAYEILLKKELDYYQNILNFISEIVVMFQDVCWNYNMFGTSTKGEEKNKYKAKAIDEYANILKLIPMTKKDNLIYINYSDKQIAKLHTDLICYIQNNMKRITSILTKNRYSQNDNEELNKTCSQTLDKCANLSVSIQKIHEDLSK